MAGMTIEELAAYDGLDVREYTVDTGPLSGHTFADNGSSMVFDLTTGKSVDADSIPEADEIVSKAE